MMRPIHNLLLLLLFSLHFFLLGCKEESHNSQSSLSSSDEVIRAEIKALTTDSLKKDFIDKLWVESNYGDFIDTMKIKYGENVDLGDKMELYREANKKAQEKLAVYLKEYGFPDSSVVYAYDTEPYRWHKTRYVVTSVLGATGDFDLMMDYIPMLYKAYKKGDLPEGRFADFLQRIHQGTVGGRVEFDGPFTTQEELLGLFQGLDINTDALDVQLME